MERSLDLSRWRERARGVGYRRWVIVSTGLRQLLRTRFFRGLLVFAWMTGALVAALGFLFSQSVASGGWLEELAGHMGARFQAMASALGGFVLLYPDICIDGLFTGIFWLQSFMGLALSLVALTVVVPRLIAQDRASNALTIYLSRPLTSVDYLLGKLGIIVGLIGLLWTGPLLAGWLLSMLFAPDRDFVVYSVLPLLRALLFNGISLVVVATIALGTSAVSRSSRAATIIWIGLWLIAGTMAKPPGAQKWLQRASFTHNLGQVRQKVFRLDTALIDAGEKLPLLDRTFANRLAAAGGKAQANDFNGAAAALCAFVALSSVVFLRKLRPE